MSAERYTLHADNTDWLDVRDPQGYRNTINQPGAIALIRQQSADIAELRAKLASSEFWRDVYPEGMTAEQVANELADYKMILENVSLVYCHVTGGRISKGNTLAGEVIREADAIMDSAIGEAVHEERQLTMQAEAERDQLRADLAAAVAERDEARTAYQVRSTEWHRHELIALALAERYKLRAEQAEARLAAIYGAPVVALTFCHPYSHEEPGQLIARPAKD